MPSHRRNKSDQMSWRGKSFSSTSFEEEKHQLKKERHNNVEKRSRMKFNSLLKEMKNMLLEAGVNMQKDPTTAVIIGKFTEHLESLEEIKQKLMIKVKTKRTELEAKGQMYHSSCCHSGNHSYNSHGNSMDSYNYEVEIFPSFEETQFQQYNGPIMDDFTQLYSQENNLVHSSTDTEGLLSAAAVDTLRALASSYDQEQLSQLLFQQLSTASSFGNNSDTDQTLQYTGSLDSPDPVSVDLYFDFDAVASFSLIEDFDDHFQQGHFDDLLNWNL